MSLTLARQAQQVIARADPEWLYGAIAEVAALEDRASALEEMRAALREYGMDSDVAREVVQQFATLVRAYSARH